MRMPFGKYKGEDLGDMPSDYLDWLLTLPNLTTRLREGIENELYERDFGPTNPPLSPPVTAEILVTAEEIILAGYRQLSMKHHPDRGGDVKKMQAVNRANGWLRERLKELNGKR